MNCLSAPLFSAEKQIVYHETIIFSTQTETACTVSSIWLKQQYKHTETFYLLFTSNMCLQSTTVYIWTPISWSMGMWNGAA